MKKSGRRGSSQTWRVPKEGLKVDGDGDEVKEWSRGGEGWRESGGKGVENGGRWAFRENLKPTGAKGPTECKGPRPFECKGGGHPPNNKLCNKLPVRKIK